MTTVMKNIQNLFSTTTNTKLENVGARVIIKMLCHQYQWLADGYDLEIGHF